MELSPPPFFTFIVVGAGSSGMMLVHELANHHTDANIQILLIERGHRDCDQLELVRAPSQWGADACSVAPPQSPPCTPAVAVLHQSAPQPDLLGRNIRCPVGAGVGGTANINAMIWTPGECGPWLHN